MIILKRYRDKKLVPIIAFLALGVFSLPSYAYLDPGTGSMLIQGIIGAVAALGVTLKLYWHKIKIMISGRKKEDDTSNKQ